jgi:glycosyltransferase involved in cell wall biosynthesis
MMADVRQAPDAALAPQPGAPLAPGAAAAAANAAAQPQPGAPLAPGAGAAAPLVSVIVPIYNVAPYLDQCLSSIEAQTLRELEIICVNDGSTDGSLDIINMHAQADKRIRVIDKPNEGYGASCNRGIASAVGEWVAVVEPDDWVEPGMYADMLAYRGRFSAEPVDVIKTPYWRICAPGTEHEAKYPCGYTRQVRPRRQPFGIAEAPALLASHPSIWSALYRREFLLEKAIRFREYPGAGWADNPFLIETLCQARLLYLRSHYYCYREDTPEKIAATAHAQPLMPFERWMEMTNILEGLAIDDPAVLDAHYQRGFYNYQVAADHAGLDDLATAQAVKECFMRMSPAIVFASPRIAPDQKLAFASILSLPAPKVSPNRHRIRQFFHYWRSYGLRHAINSAKESLRRR